MFSFLIKGEVNDDAVRLKAFVDKALSKYASLSRAELEEVVVQDFPDEQHYLESHSVNVYPTELKDFGFMLDATGALGFHLTAMGHGKYAGFMLHASRDTMHCSWSDGLSYSATGGAKKLVEMMEKKFDISNTNKLLGRFR